MTIELVSLSFGADGEWLMSFSDGSRRNASRAERHQCIGLARELYDRFAMGGWEPIDSYRTILETFSKLAGESKERSE